jgi:hypothetical protein
MIILERDIHFLSNTDAAILVDAVRNDVKHRTIILLMLDAGLRVSECITLRLSNFDFKNKLLSVISLKKRSRQTRIRQVPISQRLFLTLADYIRTLKNVMPNSYLFPSPLNKEKHITRDSVNKYLKRLENKINILTGLHPHALRHSFATALISENVPINEIADLLGHENLDTTRIYTHIPAERLRKSIRKITRKKGILNRIKDLVHARSQPAIYIPAEQSGLIIGRSAILQKISSEIAKGTNILLTGPAGVGKRAILDAVSIPAALPSQSSPASQNETKKILTLDDTAGIKKSLVYLLLYLYKNEKEAVAKILFGDADPGKLETTLSRQSVAYLCNEIKQLVKPKEYILKIKQIDAATPSTMKTFEALKDTFIIITSASEIPLNKASFLWNFEKFEIKNLERKHAFELIHKLSYDMNIRDYELYRNHIFEQTGGNPRAIVEMIERYRREPVLIAETIRSITHRGPLRDIDFSFIVIVFIASLAIFRYMTAELDNPGLRVIGGMAMILLLFSRTFFSKTKRRNL